jgi:hypothetical protein
MVSFVFASGCAGAAEYNLRQEKEVAAAAVRPSILRRLMEEKSSGKDNLVTMKEQDSTRAGLADKVAPRLFRKKRRVLAED